MEETSADQWIRNIRASVQSVEDNAGVDFATVVAGSEVDATYWQCRFQDTCRDVLRTDGSVLWIPSPEEHPKGNFLGTIKAWARTKEAFAAWGRNLPSIGLMSMVFGKGTRLSPFTQALGGRKPAFPVPLIGTNSGQYLRTAELCNLQTNLVIRWLRESGFRGMVVKWGDEAIIPATSFATGNPDLPDCDAVRFVGQVDVDQRMAREKEWIVRDAHTGLMVCEYSRQELSSLEERLSRVTPSASVGVNLGSFAISYGFLDAALEVFAEDIRDPGKQADWDPYVWIALYCRDEQQWREERDLERRDGRRGIRDLEAQYPDFYNRIADLRHALHRSARRPLSVCALDFGGPFWVDMGSHVSLRQSLESLAADSPAGRVIRELFQIPSQRDPRGNIVVRSTVPPQADIRGSIILDSVILDQGSRICGGVVLRGRHRRLEMPQGGIALDCAADRLVFAGPKAVAFRAMGAEVVVPTGGRHTSLLAPETRIDLVSNESIVDYKGDNYTQPILGNPVSFEEAGHIMAACDPVDLENRWSTAWDSWLK